MKRNGAAIILGFVSIALLSGAAYSGNQGKIRTAGAVAVQDTNSLNASRVLVLLNNRGSLDYGWGWGGGYWRNNDQKYAYDNVILFDAGIGLIGKVGGTLRVGITQWGSSYAPGPIIDGKPALWVRPQDSTRYRVYRISKGDSVSGNPDYAQWPVDLGAPVDAQGRPRVFADQTIWMVYNDADTSVQPMGYYRQIPRAALEIRQTAYAHLSTLCDSAALLANVTFFEWTVINKEPAAMDSAYFIIWADIDFWDTGANIPAIDTLRQLPYCWATEPFYGGPSAKMAVGYMPLRGPVVPSPGDTALFLGRKVSGWRNLPMSSFWPIWDDSGIDTGKYFFPATSTNHLWRVARGFDFDGLPVIDPTTSMPTKFPYSGDPVTGNGWNWKKGDGIGGGSGFYGFFGPLTLAPNDTQWLQAALVPALGKDNLDAIQVLRQHADELRAMPYDSMLSGTFPHIECPGPYVPSVTQLFQNYPNPFNAGTRIVFDIDHPTHVRLRVFDILGRKVADLVNDQRPTGRYDVAFSGVGLATGVYFYKLETDVASVTRKFIVLR